MQRVPAPCQALTGRRLERLAPEQPEPDACAARRQTVKRAAAWTLAALVITTSGPAADAQSNSLFHRTGNRPTSTPTTQPATGVAEVLLPAPLIRGLQSNEDNGPPPPNEVLLAASLIAVEAPRPRKIKVNDLITVVIREEKRATSDSDLKRDKKWEIAAELKKWIRLNEAHKLVPQIFPAGNPAVDLEYDDKYEGKGKVGRKDTLITRITAKVVDVKPNGILVLEANKDIGVDEDRQIATLTGICRSEDVTAQNTILSTQLADAKINIQHSGPARDAARRGWLARIWDFIRPL
jgi:flagellar L-ring protein precursor FlgH